MAQEGFLIKQEKYLEAGIHIGTKLRVIDMTRFIYRTRNDGLYVLDLRKVDERIRMAGKILASYDPKEIVVVASRTYSSMAAKQFGVLTGAQVKSGRFMPGTFTNTAKDSFVEPKLVIICDPKGERQAVVECGTMGIPTVGLCDTDNFTMYVDWVIPCNNKGRRSLSLIFWLFAREMAMASGKITSYDEFTPSFEDFEAAAQAAETAAQAPPEAPVADVASEAPAAEAEAEEEEEAEPEADEAEKKEGEPEAKGEEKEKPKKAAQKKAPAKKKAEEKKEEPVHKHEEKKEHEHAKPVEHDKKENEHAKHAEHDKKEHEHAKHEKKE